MILELSDALWRSVMFYFKISALIILEFHSEMSVGEGSTGLLFVQKQMEIWSSCSRPCWALPIPEACQTVSFQGDFSLATWEGAKWPLFLEKMLFNSHSVFSPFSIVSPDASLLLSPLGHPLKASLREPAECVTVCLISQIKCLICNQGLVSQIKCSM